MNYNRHRRDAGLSGTNIVRGEPFDYTRDRLVEPSVGGATLRQAQGERVIFACASKNSGLTRNNGG
ncbi:MAG: hypothetical protein IIB30_08430 [Chloroflexi bacterium]|nr:hypothetical protein [Chloroflexota bacterium]MCH8225053.1 hypothetical protein [Chloroflexota bacterium]MCI0846143.1 hypothetical protein [Chloroflexota bacterium]